MSFEPENEVASSVYLEPRTSFHISAGVMAPSVTSNRVQHPEGLVVISDVKVDKKCPRCNIKPAQWLVTCHRAEGAVEELFCLRDSPCETAATNGVRKKPIGLNPQTKSGKGMTPTVYPVPANAEYPLLPEGQLTRGKRKMAPQGWEGE